MPQVKNIDEVLTRLDEIIEVCLVKNDPRGIFAYVYRRTTAGIKEAILNKVFEDNARMEQFDVEFAMLYIDAYHKYDQGEAITRSWQIAFDAAKDDYTIIQHIMLGMNSHINLDLAIAASHISIDKDIQALKADFFKVNEILASLVNEMQEKIGKVSRLMILLDWLGGISDEKVISFSMKKARFASWLVALDLWPLRNEALVQRIAEVDSKVHFIGEEIRAPKARTLRYLLRVLSFFETRQVNKVIEALKS